VGGLLLAALYNPVWTAGITSGADFALGSAAFLPLFMWQTRGVARKLQQC
jgi:chromate transporter